VQGHRGLAATLGAVATFRLIALCYAAVAVTVVVAALAAGFLWSLGFGLGAVTLGLYGFLRYVDAPVVISARRSLFGVVAPGLACLAVGSLLLLA
jgi:hypothetical protein